MSMAAAETATASGTRRAVIRSERFVQWQRDLSSARRAPYGSRKRNDDGKINGIQSHQKESEDGNETNKLRGMEEEAGVDDASRNDILKVRVKEQQHQNSPDPKKIEREISLEPKKDGLISSLEAGLCNGQQNQLAQQVSQQRQEQETQKQESASALPIKRRRQHAPKDQELQPSRSAGGDATANMDLHSTKTSKRSTRLLARTLCMEEPLPPPLKLPKLHVVLSRKEVQEDWLQITGRRYAGKPRKSALIHLGLGLCTSLTCPSTIRYLTDP